MRKGGIPPWIVFWAAAAIHGQWGSLTGIGVCALIPLIFYRSETTVYDSLTNVLVTGIAMMMLAGCPGKWALPLSYFSFGAIWLVSCLKKVPLTANYSMNNYGGEAALQNVLFLKTNRILTMLWGVLYLFTSVLTWFLMRTRIGGFVVLINTVIPAFMGLFTVWFQKWYPAKVAGGGRPPRPRA